MRGAFILDPSGSLCCHLKSILTLNLTLNKMKYINPNVNRARN